MLGVILDRIGNEQETVISLQRELTAIPAVGPDSGGPGERAKADYTLKVLSGLGVSDVREHQAPDARVDCGHRPNIAAVLPGTDSSRTFWVISHLDIVPPGDLTLWDHDPYDLYVEDGMLVGRGVEDNQQGMVSSLLVAKALLELGVTPPINYGMLFVADEENGSKFGLDYVLKNHPEIFGKNDLFLIPDFGLPDSEMVEVAEKSMLWLKITVLGRQCHASSPEEGVNSLVAASAFILKLTELGKRFNASDPLFAPPHSTFEPTKKEANVENINTIPGRDVFYLDCRVLAQYPLDDVIDTVKAMGEDIAAAYGVTMEYEIVQREQAAPATARDAEVVTRLLAAVRDVYKCDPKPMGVGGGTVAAYLRRAGYDSVVWATWVPNAHQPNERSSIRSNIGDAQVIAHALFAGKD